MTDILKGGFLQGKKTYITAATGIIAAVAGYLVGDIDLTQMLQAVWPLATMAFLRKGVADSSK